MPKVIINDKTIEVPAGTSAMDAIFHAGFDVPLFCAEKHLSPVGACRMCLVNVGSPRKGPDGNFILDEKGQPKIFWIPKPQAACVTAISDGMAIDSLSDTVKHAQSGMVELTLANHPLDCPTCDKGGACELQDRSVEYGLTPQFYQPQAMELPMYTRFEFTRRHVDKHHPLSEFIVLDRERCIHCKRCVRYFEEVPGDEVLDFIERGVHTFINSEEGVGLPSNFSGNIVDICPVGALLDQTARFKARNWEYDTTLTTSMEDASGAAIAVDTRSGNLERIRAAERREVNQVWISDAARFGHEWVNLDRIKRPLVRREGKLVEASWEEAAEAIRWSLAGLPHNQIGLYLGGDAMLEEALAVSDLASTLNTPHHDFAGRTAYPATAFPAATFDELIDAEFVLVLGDPSEEAPTLHLRLSEYSRGLKPAAMLNHGTPFADLNIKERMERKTGKMALFNNYPAALAKWAGASGVVAPGSEAQLVAALAGQGQAPAGLGDAVAWTSKRLGESKKIVVVLGVAILNNPDAASKAKMLVEKSGAKVMCMTPAANARGLEAMGLFPGKGGAAWTDKGATAAYFGYTPSEDQLKSLRFRILHLSQLTPLAAKYADVVLPAQSAFEKRGFTINLEGRVLGLEPAGINNGEADGAIAAMGLIADALRVKQFIRLIRQATKQLADKNKLTPGKLWNVKAAQFTSPVTLALRANHPSPIYLRPTMWKQHQLTGAVAKVVEVALELNPETAKANALTDGAMVEVETPSGIQTVLVKTRPDLPAGVMYLPALGVWVGRMVEAKVLVGGTA